MHSVTSRVKGRWTDLLLSLPARPRSWVVRASPRSLLDDTMREASARDPEHFERLYATAEDPYGFDTNGVEALKFDRTLDLCGEGRFERAVEIGCSIGTFTELLAPRCEELVAVDISEIAVARAAERLQDHPGVVCEVRNLPTERPEGTFDLIVVSDVLYYWTQADLEDAVRWMEQALRPGGTLVAVHYAPFWGALLTGVEAHEMTREVTGLTHVLGEDTEFGEGRPYRIDCFVKDAAAAEAA